MIRYKKARRLETIVRKKVNRQSKKESIKSHFAVRCLQRLGYLPEEKRLVEDIQKGILKFRDRQSNRVTRWEWIDPIKGIKCILPYDKERKQIITVLFENLGEL